MNISPGGSEFVYYQTPIKSYRITGFKVNYKDWDKKQIPLVSNQATSNQQWGAIRFHRHKSKD